MLPNVRSFFPFLLLIILLAACKSNQEKITQRWVFTDLQTPSSKSLGEAFEENLVAEITSGLRKKIQGNRLVLDKDGKYFGVLLNRYITGRWEWVNAGPAVITHIDYPQNIDLKWELRKQGSKAVEFVTDAEKMLRLTKAMQEPDDTTEVYDKLLNQQGDWTIAAESETDIFNEKDPDPWSPELNKWRQKPAASETTAQIRQRVRNHLYFMYSFFNFAIKDNRYWVSQDWFFSVLKPASNGLALYSSKKLPSRWCRCFYDSAQAIKGYEMIQKTFHADITVPEESNDLKFNKLMLEKLLEAFDKGK
jgi:hypothetical protein